MSFIIAACRSKAPVAHRASTFYVAARKCLSVPRKFETCRCNRCSLNRSGNVPGLASFAIQTSSFCQRQFVAGHLAYFVHFFHSSLHVMDTPGLGTRFLKFLGNIGGFNSTYQILMRSVKQLYESCVDNIDYENFFSMCSLPNTLQSWFLVTHLHLWLCILQLGRLDEEDAKMAKRILSGVFWNDVDERIKALGVSSGRNLARSKRELVSQFYGLTQAYNEGLSLLPDTTKLQSSLLKNMTYDKKPESQVAKCLVDYVQNQLVALNQTSVQQLKETGVVTWRSLRLEMNGVEKSV